MICFVDTETTSLRPDRRAWEVALITRHDNGRQLEQHWFIDIDDLDLGNADLMSLRVGRFHNRHPQANGETLDALWVANKHPEQGWGNPIIGERALLAVVERATRGAHLIGAVPNFDADVLGQRMRAHGICPSWHYHLVDIEALTVGYLAGRHGANTAGLHPDIPLPWDSEALSRAIGVEPPGDDERHTAMGDARWVMRIWDKIMGISPGSAP